MNAITLTSSFSYRRFSLKSWVMSNRIWLNVATLVLLIGLCATYVYQVNRSVSTGYQIRELESQIHELSLMNQKLEVTTQQAQSLENVARATTMLGLVRADRPEYVQSSGASYALAE